MSSTVDGVIYFKVVTSSIVDPSRAKLTRSHGRRELDGQLHPLKGQRDVACFQGVDAEEYR